MAGRRQRPWFAGLILAALVLTALFAPYLAPHSPTEGDITRKSVPPVWMEGGEREHPLGTDRFGRDVLSRIIWGSRISLAVSLIAIGVAGTLGTVLGLISGYRGGVTDALLMRLTDIGLSLPIILIAVVMVAVSEPSFRNVIFVIALLLWPRFARQVRGETLAIKQQDFVALAVVAGRSSAWIVRRHIFPNVVPTLLVISTLQVGYVILLEGTLSFLGVGVPPPSPAWGLMIADGRGFLATAWWISLFPGLAMLLTVLAVNLMGDWLRDHLDPKLRQAGGRAAVPESPVLEPGLPAAGGAPLRGAAAMGPKDETASA
jgi:peptide/nickel transport system permease protein